MKRSMTSRVLLGAAVLIAGVGVAAAQGMQAGGGQRGEARANAGAQRGGGQAQVQQRQGGGAAMQMNRGAQRATAHTATRSSARVERPRAANTNRQATTRSVRSERPRVARTDRATAKAQRSARTDKAVIRSQRAAQKTDARARTASQTRERSTTGQASRNANTETRAQARAGRANITAEQRSSLRRVVTARNVPRVNRVNFALRRGIFVPRHYHFVRVAAFPVLIDLYPDYRPYSFFVVEDEVVFVDSGRRIVDVVPLEGGAMASSGGGAMAMETDLSPEEIREIQTVLVTEGFPLEVSGVWDIRTRDALVTFQRRHGFAATGIIDTRTVTALKLTGKISQNHIRGAGRATTGRGNTRDSIDTRAGGQRGESPNAQSSGQNRSTSGQTGNEQPRAAQGRNEPKADKAEPKAGNEPKAGQDAQPRAEREPAQPSTTGQGAREEKTNRSEPNRPNQSR